MYSMVFLSATRVTDTDAEPIVEEPIVDYLLKAGNSVRVASGPFSRKTTCIKPPADAPTVFFSTMPKRISPFSMHIPSSKTGFGFLFAGGPKMLIPFGMVMLRICLPVQSGFGLRMAGVGIEPSQLGTHRRMF